jgi:hypothetical protein
MRKSFWISSVACLALSVLVGCAGTPEAGAEIPPPPKQYTEAELNAMPPEAANRIRSQQEYAASAAANQAPKGQTGGGR